MLHNGLNIPLTVKFLKYIKSNSEKGESTSIEDIQIHFNYRNRQHISTYLNKLEDNGLIKCYTESGKRFSDITPKGVDFLYELVCSLLSPVEQMMIKTLRTDGKTQASYRLIGPLMVEYIKKSLHNQRYLIKNAILNGCEEHDVPESTLKNILEKISQILTDSSINFIETNGDKYAFL